MSQYAIVFTDPEIHTAIGPSLMKALDAPFEDHHIEPTVGRVGRVDSGIGETDDSEEWNIFVHDRPVDVRGMTYERGHYLSRLDSRRAPLQDAHMYGARSARLLENRTTDLEPASGNIAIFEKAFKATTWTVDLDRTSLFPGEPYESTPSDIVARLTDEDVQSITAIKFSTAAFALPPKYDVKDEETTDMYAVEEPLEFVLRRSHKGRNRLWIECDLLTRNPEVDDVEVDMGNLRLLYQVEVALDRARDLEDWSVDTLRKVIESAVDGIRDCMRVSEMVGVQEVVTLGGAWETLDRLDFWAGWWHVALTEFWGSENGMPVRPEARST